jgi:hypothetical protein
MADAGHFDDHRLEPVGPLWAGVPVLDADGDVYGGEEIVVYDEGRPSDVQFDHIAANDPQDTIARCEAELAILDDHAPLSGYDPHGPVCVICCEPGGFGCEDAVVRHPCRTVRLLASGYRHRKGYRPEWAPDQA